ncbi:MAG: KUP/HAK/KT family potassium transporter, partial [Bacteroidales bacterium]|nr:KUP/HAK/KT family potassium transporter [Bacteroidales bacterium]
MINNGTSRGVKFSITGVIITLGIVFGDIGTSPLYVVKATIREGFPIEENFILGVLSCVIWTLTIQTTLKYVLIFLRADNKGEGGIFALFALLRKSNRWIYILAIAGGSLLLADGIITPAITVTSSIEGLRMINPEIRVIPIVIIILTLLFLIQQSGTQYIGKSFGPVMLIWFTMLAVFGMHMIFDKLVVLKAFSPHYAIRLLVQYPGAILLLGAIFLCTTGAEALYTDLGHCGLKNIRVSWTFVKTALILNYLGQGAWVLNHGSEINEATNPFYAIMPEWFLPVGILIATAAAIIASQALISASYSLISEAISLNFWPRIKIKYPTLKKGQMYIPSINTFLWISCLLVVLIFRESENIEAAYGLSINITMLIDTFLMVSFLSIRRTNRMLSALFIITFLTVEGAFLYANLHKIGSGGWFPIIIGSALSIIMFSWYNGRKITNRYLRFLPLHQYRNVIVDLHNDKSIPKTATNLAFLTKANRISDIESKVIFSMLNTHPKRSDHYWFIHVDIVDEPHRMEYQVTRLIPGILTRVDFYLGFKVEPRIYSMFKQVTHELGKEGEIDLFSGYPSLRKHNILTDFKFIIIDRLHTSDIEFKFLDKLIINLYFFLMKVSISDVKALGFDTSTVHIEQIPLTLESTAYFKLNHYGLKIHRFIKRQKMKFFHFNPLSNS